MDGLNNAPKESWPEVEDYNDAIRKIKLNNWKHFHELVNDIFNRSCIYRGQRNKDWNLMPSMFRKRRRKFKLEKYLNCYKYATRGRKNSSKEPSEDEYWAMGQHNGLKTPLLDWTRSPYVALFFAFAEEIPNENADNRSNYRIVYALDQSMINDLPKKTSNIGNLTFVDLFTDDNPRLVSQFALFTKLQKVESIEKWICENIDEDLFTSILLKIFIPENERIECLKGLNKMNINYLTLFPDLYGASMHCNLQIDIPGY